jgi:RNA polymerase sigma-70 factor (ECF subfamily)
VALIIRLQQRDQTALALVYDIYGRRIYSLIFCMVKNTGIAEDLVQETFFRVWTRVGSFDAKWGAFGPWLMTVARNRAVDHLRSLGSRCSCNFPNLGEIEDPKLFADLERNIWISDKTKTLGEALDRLSVNQRRVIKLAYFEGYSQTEIAIKVGHPVGTVKTWVRSAMKNLREDFLRESNLHCSNRKDVN